MANIKLRLSGVGCGGPPQFEATYSVMLQNRVTPAEFSATINRVNQIMAERGTGICNLGCIAPCFCCCLVVSGVKNNKALAFAGAFLEQENARFYIPKGVQWSIRTRTTHRYDWEGQDHVSVQTWIHIEVSPGASVIVVTPPPAVTVMADPYGAMAVRATYDPSSPLLAGKTDSSYS
eukprot:TRINITY_DN38366_c1_g1_i2.p1 TRINITY_DN38366_c1_g1~~TRINITY_DN38366_c1_g1_i2.p1  ORF type:complete len:177 (+),score=36.96 TRINITY_DN38366_c1_g1_i2:48-578(+)